MLFPMVVNLENFINISIHTFQGKGNMVTYLSAVEYRYSGNKYKGQGGRAETDGVPYDFS